MNTDRVTITYDQAEAIRKAGDRSPLIRSTPRPGEWKGPDVRANLELNRSTKGRHSDELCDRLAAAAKERGRPLTQEEQDIINRGGELSPVVRTAPAKTDAQRIAELEEKVAKLEAPAPHLRRVEKRG